MSDKKYIEEISLKKEKSDYERVKISGSFDAAKYMWQFYDSSIEIYESFFILLLNRANDTIGYAKISQGGVVGATVDIKIILKYAIDALASGVIIAHNHPSGNLKVSASDKEVTEKVKAALGLVDVVLIDSIVLTKTNYTSFRDDGLI